MQAYKELIITKWRNVCTFEGAGLRKDTGAKA